MGRWDDGKGGLAHREGICQKHRTGEVGTARSPTGPVVLAPDGNALAFVATDIQGRILLWVRKLNDLHASTCAGFGGREFPNRVDMYDGSFNLVKSFTDSTIPAGFAPFGVQNIGGKLYVSYASTSGGTGGYIDIFKADGTFVKRFAHGAPLNQPWGFAVAPANFGPLSNTLLVSNNTKTGTINGFNLTTGKFVDTVKNSLGKPIFINGLWGIEFGGGTSSNGQKDQLFFTAGPNDTDGFFGLIFFK